MNMTRRKRIKSVIQTIQTCVDVIDRIRDEEDDAVNNLPENLQDSERYSAMEDAVAYLEEAEASLEEAVENLESAAS